MDDASLLDIEDENDPDLEAPLPQKRSQSGRTCFLTIGSLHTWRLPVVDIAKLAGCHRLKEMLYDLVLQYQSLPAKLLALRDH